MGGKVSRAKRMCEVTKTVSVTGKPTEISINKRKEYDVACVNNYVGNAKK